jgi:hypothetical protein
MNKFQYKDRVIYTSGHHGDKRNNPLWGQSFGNIAGTVVPGTERSWITVKWDNGCGNAYKPEDLELYVQPFKLPEDLFTL